MEQLAVWAERLEGFVRVGTLWFERGGEEWFEGRLVACGA